MINNDNIDNDDLGNEDELNDEPEEKLFQPGGTATFSSRKEKLKSLFSQHNPHLKADRFPYVDFFNLC